MIKHIAVIKYRPKKPIVEHVVEPVVEEPVPAQVKRKGKKK